MIPHDTVEDTLNIEQELYYNHYPTIDKMPWYRIINNELLLGRNKLKMTFNIPSDSTYELNQYIEYVCDKQHYVDIKLTPDTKIFLYYEGQYGGVDINEIDIDREPSKMSVCNLYVINDFYINNHTRVIVDIRDNTPLTDQVVAVADKYGKQVVIFNSIITHISDV